LGGKRRIGKERKQTAAAAKGEEGKNNKGRRKGRS